MAQNKAGLIVKPGEPLVIRDVALPQPGDNEIVVKNAALAINPIDCKQQEIGLFLKDFPAIPGHDIAGTVHAVGSAVTKFKVGDRVLAHAAAFETGDTQDGGFQLYTKISAANAAILPSEISFVDGAVLPLALDTAVAGLYLPKPFIGLPFPKTGSKNASGVIVVYGGSSSVGAAVTQLAVANGLRVIALASPRNEQLVKRAGASQFLDYHAPDLVEQVVKAVGQDHLHGIYDAVSLEGTFKHDHEILKHFPEAYLAATLPLPEHLQKGGHAQTVHGVGEHTYPLWDSFVGEALANGQLQALPKPLVVGKGLEHLQRALETHAAGVSGQKVVVEL